MPKRLLKKGMDLRQRLQQRHPAAFLLAAQFVLLFLHVIIENDVTGRAVFNAFGGVVMMMAVWVVFESPATNWVAWFLAVPAFILSMISAFIQDPTVIAIASILEAALYFYGAGALIAHMMKDRNVSLDDFFAAGATFTLLAWGFTYITAAEHALNPANLISSVVSGRNLTFLEMLMLSFSNLSATGLSDILPATKFARAIVILEQFSGVGYITLVVSRLISLSVAKVDRQRK
ncbi:MAG TPA: ion channel [Bellilinea sp.]|nr:ion channel [Bellilinea sp.]